MSLRDNLHMARRQERIQILHRGDVAPKMDGVFELEVHP